MASYNARVDRSTTTTNIAGTVKIMIGLTIPPQQMALQQQHMTMAG